MADDRRSLAERLSELPEQDRRGILGSQTPPQLERLMRDWRFWARPQQLPPPGNWRSWLVLAGRGFGKTRAGAEWVRARAEAGGDIRIALVGATLADARSIMVEGESGLIAIASPEMRPRYEPSRRRLLWPNGAQAFLYSGEDPDGLRGPQHHIGWCDEIAKWAKPTACWNMLWMGLRLGEAPQVVATTTPRPVPLVRRLLKDPSVAVTRGATSDNPHLARGFLAAMLAEHAGTSLGRQELDGEMIEDAPGALWTRARIEMLRLAAPPALARIVVAVDPPVSTSASADACGIVVAGCDDAGHGYVLEDATVQGLRPDGWMRAAIDAYHRHGADRLIAEVNNGGDLVGDLLAQIDPAVAFAKRHAARGKRLRAEPVAAAYERGQVHHVGLFAALEDQMCSLMPNGRLPDGGSPDRVDALVWALTELMLKRGGAPSVRAL